MLKKSILLLFIVFAANSWYHIPTVHSNESQPPKGRTGAPGETTCAITGCHTGAAINSGNGSVAVNFNSGGSTYQPGQTYNMSVTVSSVGASRWGFEMVALNSSNQSVGTFIGDVNQNTATGNANNRNYVYHKNAPNGNSPHTFNFQWTAPASAEGNITFYAIGNGGNDNGNDTGDLIYTTTRTISLNVGVQEVEAGSSLLNVYPNPAADQLQLSYTLDQNADVQISLCDLAGRTVLTLDNAQQSAGTHTQSLATNELPNGIYLAKISYHNQAYLQKIIISR